MPIPLATTTITVKRSPVADDYAEPYSGTSTAALDEVASCVPAVIYAPTGREVVAGGEQTVTELAFACDVTDLKNKDYIVDETSDTAYRVTWCVVYAGDHIEGRITLVEGLV